MELGKAAITTLTLISGICWTVVYVLIIIRSFRDKTYGMPFWALAFNLSWEFIFSFILSINEYPLQSNINRVWLLFDVAILVAYFKYGRKEWPDIISQKLFVPYSALVLVLSFFFVYLLSVELDANQGKYAAFTQNLMMSVLFVRMLILRKSREGQAVGIAMFKMIGTLAPTIVYGSKSDFILFLGLSCLAFDLIYLGMLIKLKGTNVDTKVTQAAEQAGA